ncbi:hypothetical protein TELCIR_18105, partial [Teladorsagia circumcincta]
MGVMYGPVCIMGYLTYHDSIRDSIIPSIQTVWIQQAINILITVHCILTLTIVFNPLNQELEDLFHCPHHFGWQRALIRTVTMLAVAFVAESIPNFGPLLDLFVFGLIGGAAATFSAIVELTSTNFLLPCYVSPFVNKKHPNDNGASVYCCGPYQNLTHNGLINQCVPMPSKPFY